MHGDPAHRAVGLIDKYEFACRIETGVAAGIMEEDQCFKAPCFGLVRQQIRDNRGEAQGFVA